MSGEKFQLQGCLGNGKHAEFIFIFGGKKGKKIESFLPLPDGLQQKQLERLVTCQNQSST